MIKQEKSKVRLKGGKVSSHLEEDELEIMTMKRKCGCGSNKPQKPYKRKEKYKQRWY